MLADAFVILVSLLLGAVALTQILIPLIQNEPLFFSLRKSYQREKWLKRQLAETNRRLAELELEKQLSKQRNELIQRQTEHLESYTIFDSPPADGDGPGVSRRNETSEKEH